MAKRASRKQSATRKGAGRKTARKSTRSAGRTASRKTARTGTRKTGTRKAGATRKTSRAGAARRTAARKTTSKVARSKNAARAAASRNTSRKGAAKEPSTMQSATTAVKGAVANAVAAVAKRLPGAKPEEMDALTMLEADHRRMEELLRQGEDTSERAVKTRGELLATITTELGLHELIEERLLYPALKQYPEARDIVLEGFQEHHVADVVLKELHEVAKDDEQWGAKFKVLKENIEHHIQEEEGPMFRTARGVMSQEQLVALGKQMARMKRDAEKGRVS